MSAAKKGYNVELVLVVIDTIISVGAYEDDNSRALTSAVMQKVRNVSMTNDIFTSVVDHVGKDKKRGIMGSIAKVANADVVLLLDVTKKDGIVTGRKMILHMMRGGAAGTVNNFSLKEIRENERGDSFITVEWHGSLRNVCNLLLRCIRECEDPGDLLHPKKDLRVKEEDVRNRFYKEYGGERDANRNAFNRAKAQAIARDMPRSTWPRGTSTAARTRNRPLLDPHGPREAPRAQLWAAHFPPLIGDEASVRLTLQTAVSATMSQHDNKPQNKGF